MYDTAAHPKSEPFAVGRSHSVGMPRLRWIRIAPPDAFRIVIVTVNECS